MGRSFVRKTPKRDPKILRQAVAAMKSGSSLRATARKFGIPRSTLLLHRRNNETNSDENVTEQETKIKIDVLKIAEKGHKAVFSKEQEDSLENHLLHLSDIYFGLNPIDARTLAYELANKLKVLYPPSWKVEKMAGLEWFRGFTSRHPRLARLKKRGRPPGRTSILTSDAELQRISEKGEAKELKKKCAEEKAKQKEENRKLKLKKKEDDKKQREEKQRLKDEKRNGKLLPSRTTTRRSAVRSYIEAEDSSDSD